MIDAIHPQKTTERMRPTQWRLFFLVLNSLAGISKFYFFTVIIRITIAWSGKCFMMVLFLSLPSFLCAYPSYCHGRWRSKPLVFTEQLFRISAIGKLNSLSCSSTYGFVRRLSSEINVADVYLLSCSFLTSAVDSAWLPHDRSRERLKQEEFRQWSTRQEFALLLGLQILWAQVSPFRYILGARPSRF